MRARSIALCALSLSAGLALLGLSIRGTREEGDAMGTLLGASAVAPNVNEASLATVNAERAPPVPSVGSMVDTTELARRMLGMPCPLPMPECTNDWGGLTSDQQQEVTELLRRLIEKKVTTDDRKTLAAAISDRRSEKLGNGLTRIRTEAKANLRSQEAVVQIDYVVIQRSDHHYSVVDVVTEGSSMAKGYYVQLHRMLTTPDQGYAFMVKKLEAKLARQ